MNRDPGESRDLSGLSPWADELAKTFVSLASDIALVMDESGVITNIAQAGGDPVAPGASAWIGRSWADTVSGDTRRKIELMLQEVKNTGLGRRREVNHPGSGGGVPVAYTAIRLGQGGPVLAVGRDLRAIAAIQQRLLDSQQDLERGYWQLRQVESRDRRLQQVATDAVFVVDAATLALVAANANGTRLFGIETAASAGEPVIDHFDAHSRVAVEELLCTARSSGRPVEIRARLAGRHTGTHVSATPFRSGDTQRLLMRVRRAEAVAPSGRADSHDPAAATTLILDSSARILSCTPAFVRLAGLRDETEARGRSLGDWLAGGVDTWLAEVRLAGLAERPDLTLSAGPRTGARLALGAALLTEGDQECIGVQLSVDETAAPTSGRPMAEVLAGLDGQLGRATLAELLRDATARVERHLVGQALARSHGDPTAAARLLGVSDAALEGLRQRSDPTTGPGEDA